VNALLVHGGVIVANTNEYSDNPNASTEARMPFTDIKELLKYYDAKVNAGEIKLKQIRHDIDDQHSRMLFKFQQRIDCLNADVKMLRMRNAPIFNNEASAISAAVPTTSWCERMVMFPSLCFKSCLHYMQLLQRASCAAIIIILLHTFVFISDMYLLGEIASGVAYLPCGYCQEKV
jgi:hypothetical protein